MELALRISYTLDTPSVGTIMEQVRVPVYGNWYRYGSMGTGTRPAWDNVMVTDMGTRPWVHSTLVPYDFDISPLHSDQRRRYRQSKVGSLLVSPRLFVRQICYERLKKNRLDATINARFPRGVVKHAGRNVCAV